MSDTADSTPATAVPDHATQVLAHATGELEAVLRGYLQIVHALALITRDDVDPLWLAAVEDIRSSRPTGRHVRQLLGWLKHQTQTRVDEATEAALGVLSTDITQRLGHLITSG